MKVNILSLIIIITFLNTNAIYSDNLNSPPVGISVVTSVNIGGVNCLDVGDEIIYLFTVTNLDGIPYNSITVYSDLHGGDITTVVALTGDTDNNGLLDPTETWVFTAPNYTVTQADVDAASIIGNVVIDGFDPNNGVVVDAVDTFVIATETLCNNGSIAVVTSAVNAFGGSCIDVADEVIYSFTVTNTGSLTIELTTITAPMLGGDITADVSFLSGDTNGDTLLNPTEIWVFTAPNYVVTQQAITICSAVTDPIINIPDANFKAFLLEASEILMIIGRQLI